jgi:hypothetical protein
LVIKYKRGDILISTKYWIKYSFLLFVLLAVIVFVLRSIDPAIDDLEIYLETSGEISKHVGVVKDYQIINTRYVSETVDTPSYNEYSIRVIGAKGRARFKLRAEYLEDSGDWEYYVLRIYND